MQDTTNSSQSEDVRKFFSGFADQWDSLYGGRRNLFWRLFDHAFRRDVYERYQMTFEQLGNLTGASVLDIGCGSGIYCCEAARRGATRVVGIDVADDMIPLGQASAKKEGFDKVCEFVATDFPPTKPVPVLDRTYDFGIVMGVMDYVPDAAAFLTALRPRITQRAVISFPGRHWLREPVRRARYKMLGRCDIFGYDERGIREDCKRAGFGRVDITRLNHSGICYMVTVHAKP